MSSLLASSLYLPEVPKKIKRVTVDDCLIVTKIIWMTVITNHLIPQVLSQVFQHSSKKTLLVRSKKNLILIFQTKLLHRILSSLFPQSRWITSPTRTEALIKSVPGAHFFCHNNLVESSIHNKKAST
jgi:hypothetical protein